MDQASRYRLPNGRFLDGRRLCCENVADLGGVRLAHAALLAEARRGEVKGRRRDEGARRRQEERRFFEAWARLWRERGSGEARALQRSLVDTHAPSEYRVNGPLSNMPEFHAAFDVVQGDPMYVREEDRTDVW